jgi:arylsulfatase
MLVRWPKGIAAKGEVRRQYAHAIDIVPTVLDVIGIAAPAEIGGVAQKPIEGVSFAHTFDDAAAASRHDTQYYEMLGCRALYDKGWKAVTHHPIFDPRLVYDDDVWELYHVDEDVAECHDLASERPEKLQELIDRWWVEAERYQVLPLDNAPFEAIFGERTQGNTRTRYVYYPNGGPVPERDAVNVRNRSHTITAEVSIPAAGAEGVLLAQGSSFGGYALFVQGGRLHYVHNYVGALEHRVSSDVDVPAGERTLAFRFAKTGEHAGTGTLLIDGSACGSVQIDKFTPTRFSITGEGLCCGYDAGMPVCRDYRTPFRFTGTIRRVVVEVDGPVYVDPAGEAELSIRAQ